MDLDSSKKFRGDVLWNFASLFFLAASGLALNILIGYYYGAAVLGVFNQALAFYIILSQLATAGIQLSVLKFTPECSQDREKVLDVSVGALLPTLLLAAVVTGILIASKDLMARFLDSQEVAEAILWIAPGLFFFALNKVMMAILNGLSQMRAYAVFNSIRYIGILLALGLALLVELKGSRLSYVFSFCEALLFLCLSVYLRGYFVRRKLSEIKYWVKRHLDFGVKSMLSGAMLELNSRVDVLMLGYFMMDKATGIYSFAAMFVEGILHFFVVLQNNYNPLMSKYLSGGKLEELVKMFRKGRFETYKYSILILPIVVFCYPYGVEYVLQKPDLVASSEPFAILLISLIVVSGYFPFHGIFMMGNKPVAQTLFMVIFVSFNILFNGILIPMYGIVGAAIGTGMAWMCGNLTLIIMSQRLFRIRLI